MRVTSRAGFVERMTNTEVKVYSTVGGEDAISSCGKIIAGKIADIFKRFVRNHIRVIFANSSKMTGNFHNLL